ncbi:DNA polymerase III subunit delta [Metarhizobium album]|uniref:DNA polymerase III subunit delta n=1 Tax=Metarhizobium album TaxID=2182425 RepID=A0A2U2DHK2_9HYPH|nr:DNA polymerase III subunit delta [Rhizobium album]PWE52721.1 DNA polymerase III subunit delta [Rhizobium album]
MAEVKSHEFDQFLRNSARLYRIFIIYGPDRGLVSERAGLIAAGTKVPADDPFAFVKLDVTDLHGNAGRLLDEAYAIGLFGGQRLIWLRGVSNEKPVIEAVQALIDKPPEDCTLILEAGDLKKGVGLRKLADGARSIASIPCYSDDGRALNALVDSELSSESLKITPSARHLLLEFLGGDRIASRNEIQKLALYCRGLDTVDEQHVFDIIGDASAISADDAVDAVLKGDKEGFLHETRKIATSKMSIFLVLQSCLRQLQLLDVMRAEMDEKNTQPAQIMQTLGRHLYFRRKPVIEALLKNWSAATIAREMNRVQSAILQTRQRQSLEESIALQTLLAVVLQAGRKS